MPNTVIASAQALNFIPEIWLNTALGRLKAYLTVQRTVTRDIDLQSGEVFNVGATLHLPKRGALTVNDKAETINYTVQNPQSDKVDLTLNKHKEVTFAVESRALSTVNQDIIKGYVEDACIALAEQVDTDLFSLYGDVLEANVVTNLSTMTEANILSVRKLLVDNKVPALMRKYGIVATSQTNALLQIDRLVRYDALGISNDISNAQVGDPSTRTMPSSIGKVHGFELSESQLVPTAGSPLAAQNLFYAEDAILFASRPLENPDGNLGVQATVVTDPDTGIALRLLHSYQHTMGAHLITLDLLYGYTLMRPEHFTVVNTSP